MRILAIILAVSLLLGGIVGGIVYYASLPKNAAEQLEYAKRVEQRRGADIIKLKSDASANAEKIARYDGEIDAAYGKVVEKYPATPEAEEADYTLLNRERAAGKLKGRDLIARYEQFTTKYPETKRQPEILLRIAKIYDEELNLKGEAIRIYEDFVKKFPEDKRAAEALFEIARIQEQLQEFETAEKTYSRLIEEFPDSELVAEAQYRRGNLRADKLDKKKEALDDFKKVEENAPDSKQARVAAARRQEIGREVAQDSNKEAQQEYYGTEEVSFMSAPLQDWNDPTVTVIREQGVDSLHYEVAVSLDPATAGLKGEVKYRVRPIARTLSDQFIMQFNGGMAPSVIEQNGKNVSYEQKGNFLHMALAEPMRAGDEHLFHFVYDGTADANWKGDAISEKGTYLRPESRWYPYTSWGDEFTVDLDITVPKGVTAIGPGLLTNSEATSDTVTFSWKQETPIGILALVANKYVKLERDFDAGRVLLQSYVYPEHEAFGPLYLDEMENILAYYETLFGPFPYEKMAVAEIPYFPGGYGSPTLLMITEMVFNDRKKVVAEFLAHEISHQWFGNLLGLTLGEDSHPWLSEGFATYVDALYIEHRKGHDAFIGRVRDMANLFIESLLAFEDIAILDCLWDNPMYRTVAYEKGGLVLHTLRFVMGDDVFFAAMRDYVDRFTHKTVTVADFQRVMEDHHGESLEWFFNQWLRGTGMPHYYVAEAKADRTLVPGGASGAKPPYRLSLTLQQLDDAMFEGPVEVKVQGATKSEEWRQRFWLDGRERVVTFDVPFEPTKVTLDPDAHLLKYPSIDDLEEDVKLVEVDPAP